MCFLDETRLWCGDYYRSVRVDGFDTSDLLYGRNRSFDERDVLFCDAADISELKTNGNFYAARRNTESYIYVFGGA